MEKEIKKIQEYLESKGIDFSQYNPIQRADLIEAFQLGKIIGIASQGGSQ